MYDKQHPWLMIIMKYLCSYFWSVFWQLKHSRLNKWQFMWLKLIIVSFRSVNYITTKFIIIIIYIVVIVAVITLTPSAPSSWYNFGYMTAYWQSSNFTDTRKSGVKIGILRSVKTRWVDEVWKQWWAILLQVMSICWACWKWIQRC